MLKADEYRRHGQDCRDLATKMKAEDIKKWLTAPAEMEKKLPKKPAVTMSGWMKTKKFTPEQIDALVAYMLTLK